MSVTRPSRRLLSHPVGAAVLRATPAVLWAAAIFAFSSQPDLPRAPSAGGDFAIKKLAHLTVYAVLAVLVHHALGPVPSWGERARYGLALAITVLYGVTDELHQALVPGRTPGPLDVMFDGVGAVFGLAARAANRGVVNRVRFSGGRLTGVRPDR